MQYATEKPDAPYEIRVYPGANAQFEIYEDDNETYKYEQGQYATTPIRWDEQKATLTIGARRGGFPGMIAQRKLRIALMSSNQPGGAAPLEKADAEISYTGEEMIVPLARAQR
jgi:alpha-D-xyloside xylohydrolase